MNSSQRIPLDGEIRDGRHFLAVRVYYEDTDFTGIVYHANYLRYMERGRTNHLRLIGCDHRALLEATEKEAPGFAFVVCSMTLDFLRPARMDVLEIVTEPKVVKGASIILRQRVMLGDEILSRPACASRLSAEAGRGRFPIRCASPCAPTRRRDPESPLADWGKRSTGAPPEAYLAGLQAHRRLNS
jgi:acyl-CoA thioester hydrolase